MSSLPKIQGLYYSLAGRYAQVHLSKVHAYMYVPLIGHNGVKQPNHIHISHLPNLHTLLQESLFFFFFFFFLIETDPLLLILASRYDHAEETKLKLLIKNNLPNCYSPV